MAASAQVRPGRLHRIARGWAVVSALLLGCRGAPTSESEQAVRELWAEYLAAPRDARSAYWSPAERSRWPHYDLAGAFLTANEVPDVVEAVPLDAAVDTAYRIVTRFWPGGSAARDPSATPVLRVTVYARRERGRWVLSGALPYHTRTWMRATSGRIRYVVSPKLRFNPERAARAAAFVDSLATAFDVPAPPHIEYYVTESVDQAMEILGAVPAQRFGPNGGFARPVNAQVFSGIPALGEEYRHELVHVLLAPLLGDDPSVIASEGVPTWLGGTSGRDFPGSVRRMVELLQAQPALDLYGIIYSGRVPSDIRNAAGAVLADMLHDAGGVDAVRAFLQASSSELPEALARLLGRPWDTVVSDWRARVDQLAAT